MQVNEISLEFKQLHRKFINDFNLPLQVVQEPFFHERLTLLEEEYGAQTKYLALSETLRDHFDSKPGKFMEYGHSLADKIIGSIINSDAYKNDFLSKLPTKKEVELMTNEIKGKITKGRKLYTQEQDGCMFVSFDMKTANFQLMKYMCPAILKDEDSYENFISRFTDIDYFKFAKGLRQTIFGKINPQDVSNAEFIKSCEFALNMMDSLERRKYEPYSLNNDEVIFKFKGTEEEFLKDVQNSLTSLVSPNGIVFKVEKFKLHARKFQLATSEQELCVFEKEDILKPDKRKIFCCPATYYPQVYKLLHGLEIKENDLVFYYEHELCKFLNPLKLIK
jgi:hypothetical protein